MVSTATITDTAILTTTVYPNKEAPMKSYTTIAWLLALTFLVPVHGAAGGQASGSWHLSDDLSIRSLMPDVYLVEHRFPWPANSLLIRCSSTEILWIDTPYTPDAARRVHTWSTERFGPLQHMAINTGCHADNLGGNGFLAARGIPVYGADLTARRLTETGEITRQKMLTWLAKPSLQRYHEAHASAVYTPPDTLFELRRGLHLVIGEQIVEVIYPGPSHAADNVAVWLPRKKLLFAGCMVKPMASESLGFTTDADLDGWPLALTRLAASLDGVRTVVPGHGRPGSRDLIWHTLALFQDGDRR